MKRKGDSVSYFLCSFLFSILFAGQIQAQTDSIQYWQAALSHAGSFEKAVNTEEDIQRYFERNKNRTRIIQDAEIILSAAARSEYATRVFLNYFIVWKAGQKSRTLKLTLSNWH